MAVNVFCYTCLPQENAVVTALADIFKSFAAEEAQYGETGKHRQAISPAALRQALHACCEERFRLGEGLLHLLEMMEFSIPLHQFARVIL